jgi:hypothetical protein
MNDVLSKLKEAMDKNKLHIFLWGEEGYGFTDPWIESPTDVSRVFLDGFNKYVTAEPEKKEDLKKELSHTLILMSRTPVGTWWVLSILHSYLFEYQENALLFQIDFHIVVPEINRGIKEFEENLKTNKEWVGWRFENGLWDVVTKMAKQINQELKKENLQIILA